MHIRQKSIAHSRLPLLQYVFLLSNVLAESFTQQSESAVSCHHFLLTALPKAKLCLVPTFCLGQVSTSRALSCLHLLSRAGVYKQGSVLSPPSV